MEQPEVKFLDPNAQAEEVVTQTQNDAIQQEEVGEGSVQDQGQVEEIQEQEPQEVITETNSEIEIIDETSDTDEGGVAGQLEGSVTPSEQEEIHPQDQTQELPKPVQKYLEFYNETGGSAEDYARLNVDVETLDEDTLLKEFYKQSKPHLNDDEIDHLLTRKFSYDEDSDDPADIRDKQISKKEELYNAKKSIEANKEQFYVDLKSGAHAPEQYQEALSFYNSHLEQSKQSEVLQQNFLKQTGQVFSDDYKGFSFDIGNGKKGMFKADAGSTMEAQKDLSTFVQKFLDDQGNVKDPIAYHKAIFAARNADQLTKSFYELGYANAIKERSKSSKNVDMDPSPTPQGNIPDGSGPKLKFL